MASDDVVLARLMRRTLTDPQFNFYQIISGDLILDGRLFDITDEEVEVVIRVGSSE